jgi:phosphatidylinositol-3-phosphatase
MPKYANIFKSTALTLIGLANAATASVGEAHVPVSKFGHFDHVFLIMMENETNTDILGNANAPFINAYAKVANQATNYFAVGHPSAPNYLETVGGSSFGLSNDYWPNWFGLGCIDNAPGSTGCANAFTPISATGTDNTVVATAINSSQCNGQVRISGTPATYNCARYSYQAAYFTPKSIADQLVHKGLSWKSYQESLPTVVPGAFGVNYSDGAYSRMSPVAVFGPGAVQKLYAVKHNPFAYFQNIETGDNPALSFSRIQDFDGPDGLWADLQHPERTPNFSFIVPNQCHDMHGGVSGGTFICSTKTAAETGYLMLEGDAQVAKIINGIKNSPVWSRGHNAIILVWDENDYSNAANRVVFLSETNYAANGVKSQAPYDHRDLIFEPPTMAHCPAARSPTKRRESFIRRLATPATRF